MQIKEFKPKIKDFSFINQQFDQNALQKDFYETWKIKKTTATVPTYSPKNFYEQIVFYKNGSTYRVYFWLGTWKYITLT